MTDDRYETLRRFYQERNPKEATFLEAATHLRTLMREYNRFCFRFWVEGDDKREPSLVAAYEAEIEARGKIKEYLKEVEVRAKRK